MSKDRSFLAKINDEPANRAARLVYADWLEEQGDPRGELIRIEEEMRGVAIYSDRYWQLKPRRNELRQSAEPDWLSQMRYGTEYEPVFRDIPDGWKERWRLIREFTERWHGIPMGDVGEVLTKVPRMRRGRRFGFNPETGERVKLQHISPREQQKANIWPPSLREWFVFGLYLLQQNPAAIVPDPNGVCDHGEVLFLGLLESKLSFCVRKEHMREPDPVVSWGDGETGREWTDPHVTTFAFRYMVGLVDWCWEYPNKAKIQGTYPKQLLTRLNKAFPVRSKFDDISIFEGRNVMAVLTVDADGPGYQLDVMVKKPDRKLVPEFLWGHMLRAYSRTGIFEP
jgi:uncharacterized protein (TIGR02996 family)